MKKETLKNVVIGILSVCVICLAGSNGSNTSNTINKETPQNLTYRLVETSSIDENKKQDNAINDEEINVEEYQSKITELETQNGELNLQKQQLEEQLENVSSQKSELESQVNSLTTQNQELQNKVNSLSSTSSQSSAPKVESPVTNSYTVYITNTGSKYHRESCSYLKQSKIAIDESDAIARGYTACSRCNP